MTRNILEEIKNESLEIKNEELSLDAQRSTLVLRVSRAGADVQKKSCVALRGGDRSFGACRWNRIKKK